MKQFLSTVLASVAGFATIACIGTAEAILADSPFEPAETASECQADDSLPKRTTATTRPQLAYGYCMLPEPAGARLAQAPV